MKPFWLLVFFSFFTTSLLAAPHVSWYDLMDYDTDTGKISNTLTSYLTKRIKVVGFIVPLIDNLEFDTITEFYLVPDPMMCIHVPAPPPNQMIHIKMEKPIPLNIDFEGVWITGKLIKNDSPIEYGKPGFTLMGTFAEECKDYPYDEFLDPLEAVGL